MKTYEQFYEHGCDNCAFFKKKGYDPDTYTSAYFDGLVALAQPQQSWIGKWQRLTRFVEGCYALQVIGDFDQEIQDFLDERNIVARAKPVASISSSG